MDPSWQDRGWRFVADMNGDGVVTTGDVRLWAEWLYFLPGDAAIAQLGATPLAAFLGLTPASFGGGSSAAISAAGWLLAVAAVRYLCGFLIDCVDPTYRQQRREQRAARRERKRRSRLMRKPQRVLRRTAPLPVEERREPRL